ncbi:uncharacterized protein N7482_006061 [Penicillium canariense]|uniref:Uncharacterized protein n=1 Tax=Penicillium canariense TaxID=189055 RepID=A0A9W9I3K0_9EURO|nr:uncharacterized protein N7482_006061 [Penicillium canariense]KAJ5167280.1 hypothetical protein N7482_006061 [Penicillium canariense]
MDPPFDEEPVWITNEDARSEPSEPEESIELPELSNVVEPKCAEIFRATRPESWAIDAGDFCLFPSKPKLCFQIHQRSSWSQSAPFQLFNLWRPASYFGATLTHLGPTPIKLNRDDLIVTGYEDDTVTLKTGDTGAIPFTPANVVACLDIDRPGFLCCTVCFSYRGRVILANGERWSFDEIDNEVHTFTRERDGDSFRGMTEGKSLTWGFYHGSTRRTGDVPQDLPFTMDRDTRICRINRSVTRADPPQVGAVLAVMNRDGIVCCEGFEKNAELETANIRELVVMTALAVAQYANWLKE